VPEGGWKSEYRPVALDGPGSLWCSVHDIDRWLGYLHSLWITDGESRPLESSVPYVHSDHQQYLYGPGLYVDPAAPDPMVFHFGHEEGFSAAAHLTRSGLRVVCLSNRADLHADHVAARVFHHGETVRAIDPDKVLQVANQFGPTSPLPTFHERPNHAEGAPVGESLGKFACVEVPGVLRLFRKANRMYLGRRGVSDELNAVGTGSNIYAGPGYRLTLHWETGARWPAGFTLDLSRAPGLHYERITK
jgi:hypothetical protein